MARSGQLKTRIDKLKKKIEAKGSSLKPELKRTLHKKLKRLQRSRRTSVVLEKRAAGTGARDQAAGGAVEAKPAGGASEPKEAGA